MQDKCLKIFLLVLLSSLLADSQHAIEEEQRAMPPWWSSMLGIRTVEPRAVRNDVRQEKFWATRGKRGDKNMFIKPNGLFQPISGKRGDLAIKPNGFFMMGKRSSPVFTLKPNGFFASFDDKRSLSLKPNGIFSLTKRSNSGTDFHKRYIKPNGLFSIAKRGLDDDMEDDIEYDGDLELAEEDVELVPGKRGDGVFLSSKVDKMPELFWATRG